MILVRANTAISIPYDSPYSGIIQIKVSSTESTNVFAIGRWQVKNFERRSAKFLGSSALSKDHQFIVELTPDVPWNLMIENPWTRDVEVNYIVQEMTRK